MKGKNLVRGNEDITHPPPPPSIIKVSSPPSSFYSLSAHALKKVSYPWKQGQGQPFSPPPPPSESIIPGKPPLIILETGAGAA
jgi:hypothetical protein